MVFRAQLNLVALPKLPGSVHRNRSRLSIVVICKCAFGPTTPFPRTLFPFSRCWLSLYLDVLSAAIRIFDISMTKLQISLLRWEFRFLSISILFYYH